MKIPAGVLHFEGKTALVLVTGTEEANFFVAKDGMIDNVFHFVLEKIKFSDREDKVKRGSAMFENGSKIEKIKKLEKVGFINSFKDEVKKLSDQQKFDFVYLLSPASIIKELEKALPAGLKKKLQKSIQGNFCKETPFEILKKISHGWAE